MSRYFCDTCKKFIFNSNLEGRKTHLNGQKHIYNRRKHFLNIINNEKYKEEIEWIKRITKGNEMIMTTKKEREYSLPPIQIDKIIIPKQPENFKLPKNFDYKNILNYPKEKDKIERMFCKNNI
ncbi:U1 small nuclear ribonucleoprotein [Spraguea lophii 42_110]|uniref:U1 small nuclear ribonucleoprotein n=1 Tax=Spraguea lophii (strain 42_110) TaxID=1358809 RepID=S7W897_SPRLO|nr:U1 small nuclear ribonucleoprotein [Spraguea lophii 42_110]